MLARVGTILSLANHFQIRAKKAGKNREEHAERAAELEADHEALLASVRESGIIEPLKVCLIEDETKPLGVDWWIVDGRNRWMAAQFLKLPSVPVMAVPACEAPAIIAATVAGRRHYSKGATAYLACLLNPEVALEGGKRQKAALKQGPSRTECGTGEITPEILAAKFSVSLRLMEQAAELFRLLEGDGKPFRDDAEANIWAGCGLGGVKAGVDFLIANGKAADTSKPDPASIARAAAWQAFRGASTKVSDLWKRWDALDAEQRETVKAGVKSWLGEAPEEVRALIAETSAIE
jgi:hypothetical protein